MQDFFWFFVLIATNGLLLLLLAINISRLRIKHKISLGDGGNKDLMKAMRVHSNGVEQVPVYALIILALTFATTNELFISSLVITFTLSRVMHAYGILYKKHTMRQIGAGLTYIAHAAGITLLLFNISH